MMFWAALLSERSDDCLRSAFIPLHVAIGSIHSRFYEYVLEQSFNFSFYLHVYICLPVCLGV